ncbi:hypothetical protein GFW03_24510 [Salmonella enterica]|uniref:Uncharacterized protein n=2 Tax=Salmonella enterica TaxID=28901 RepID=A0A5Z7Y1P1_SALNE|nr:hypothetical protein [Salmonella enterica]EBS4770977.1 hypothetical protein [Salmonella enterica subsp. enterica serovar Sandiego]ECH8236681.1 hypothetical protein [Salmonella enterica subsp. enterica]ECS7537577.1 hypothetical protein [Salmonella enterica subsp. enterica serovar Newport]EAB3662337.1 hypothetical protein [Salmonella enterica]
MVPGTLRDSIFVLEGLLELPALKSETAPAQRAGTISLLIPDDVTKLLSGFLSRMALQGDGPLREPSPRQQGVLCAVVNH